MNYNRHDGNLMSAAVAVEHSLCNGPEPVGDHVHPRVQTFVLMKMI